MALPITLGALVFKSKDIDLADVDGPFVLGIVVAGGTGALAMRLFLRYLARPSNSLLPFAIYRWVIAVLIVALRRGRRRP
jgi:undecaprenyl pyrophosphate phosphatase UppP